MRTTPRTPRRLAAITAVLAVVAALLSPAAAAQAGAGTTMTGVTTGGNSAMWRDASISSVLTEGTSYTDSLQSPEGWGEYYNFEYQLPDGLSATMDPVSGVIVIQGTPTVPGEGQSMFLEFFGSDSEHFTITFSNVVVIANKTATTTAVTSDSYSYYQSLNLRAIISSFTSGGTVDFYLDDTLIGNDVAVNGVGEASYLWAAPQSFVGSSPVVKAVYSGDATYAGSTSISNPTVYIYGDRVITGSFLSNGLGLEGRTIKLLDALDLGESGLSTTTNADGEFSIQVPAPTSLADAQRGFVVEDSGAQLYYSATAAWKQPNVQNVYDATKVYEASWASPLNLLLSTDPTWTDQTLANPRMGEGYSDSVVATTYGVVSAITYSLSGDPLPSWLTFSNGTFTSAEPGDQLAHTFTVHADSSYGAITKVFTLQAGAAGVAPSFEDTTIADLQVGTPLTDAIMAVGDPTITYSSTPLPAGLTLNEATGELTGTPTTAGEYVVTFTASNEFGDDTYIWEPTVKAAPDLELTLNFAAGTTIETASTEIGAGGLKVGSTYTLTMYSTPRILYTGTIDASGAFLHTVTLPADTPVGAHELVLTGIAPDGSVLTARAWFTLLSNGRIGAISYAGPLTFSLAATGSEPMMPIGIASALLLAGFLALRRSRAKFAPQ